MGTVSDPYTSDASGAPARTIFRSEALFRTLACLARSDGRPLPIEELVAFVGTTRPAVLAALGHLESVDLVSRRKAGRRYLYTAGVDHPLFPELASLTAKLLPAKEPTA